MVGIAQSVERLVVVQEVAGSSPVTHPKHLPNGVPVQLDAEAFEELVVDELDQLPDDMVDGLDNVVFVVEDRPEDGSLDLLGLYEGTALTERDRYGFGEMPDRIVLYREPLLSVAETEDELREEIHVTLVHEIAHYYGIDDDRLHQLGWA
jgi:predicted Zn-dependent protease with MMP-like domain